MKILLLSPPFEDFYFTPARIEPLGLLYACDVLRHAGHDVELVDLANAGRVSVRPWPADFEYLRRYYHKDLSFFGLFSSYKRMGADADKIDEIIAASGAGLVLVQANFTAYVSEVRAVAEAARRLGKITACGGWAVNSEGESVFADCGCDYMLAGSAESCVSLFADFIEGKIPASEVPGLIFRQAGNIVSNPPHFCPPPDSYPLRHGTYYFKKKKIGKTVLSRGCRNNCSFCAVHRHGKFSFRSLESFEYELEYLRSIGTEIVNIEDDCIFFDDDYSRGLLDLLKKFSAGGMRFCAMNGMTARDLLPWIDDALDSGFIEFNMSLVSSSKAAIDDSRRPFSVEAIDQCIEKISGRAETIVYLIAGLRGSTCASLSRDIKYLASRPVTVGVSPLYSLPQMPFFDEVIPDQRKFMRGSALYKFFEGFSREDVASAMKAARMINRARSFGAKLSPEECENLEYFAKSVKRKKWYRKVKGGWIDSFDFAIDLSGINVLLNGGGTISLS